jgi:hypothetical protein
VSSKAETFSDHGLRNLKKMNLYVAAIIVFSLAFPIVYTLVANRNIQKVEFASVDNAMIIGPTDLCLGGKLNFTYDVHVKGRGILIRDVTTWRVDPPKTVIFADTRRSILLEEIDQHLQESYRIPYYFKNYETGDFERLSPGNYERRFALSTPNDQRIFSSITIPFSIRENPHDKQLPCVEEVSKQP